MPSGVGSGTCNHKPLPQPLLPLFSAGLEIDNHAIALFTLYSLAHRHP
jgi:hypothetical protein